MQLNNVPKNKIINLINPIRKVLIICGIRLPTVTISNNHSISSTPLDSHHLTGSRIFSNGVNWLIDFLILAIIGLAPVYFAFIYKDYSVFALDKVVVFRALTEILLLLYIIKIVLSRQIKLTLNKWQIILPALFFLSYFLATIFSVSPHTSFWGHYWRHQGLFTYLHYFLFFLLVGLNYDFIQEKKQKRFLAVILISSFVVCLYGIIQYLGLDWYRWKYSLLLQRVNSTLGQPNFLGAYLVLIIPLSVFALYKFKKFYIRFIILIVLFLQFLILILTYSRAAWLGIIFIFILGVSYFCYFFGSKKIKILFFVFCFILPFYIINTIYSGEIIYYEDKALNFKDRLQNTIHSLFVMDKGSNKVRLDSYVLFFSLIKHKPLLGYGPETIWLWYPEYYNGKEPVRDFINSHFDRTHNEILDIIIFTGLAGLIFYLSIIFYLLFKSGKILLKKQFFEKDKNNFLYLFFVLSGLIGYLITIQFGFSITVTNIYFWLYLAIVFVLINRINNINKKIIIIKIKPIIKNILLFTFFICITYIVYQFNINKIRADIYFFKAMAGITIHENFNAVNDKFLKSLQYNPGEDFYRARYADKLISTAKTIETCEEKNQLLISANSFLQEIPEDRRDINMRINIVKARAFYYYCLDSSDFSEIDKMYQDAINFSPQLASLRLDGGEMYYYIEEYDKAIENFKNALKLYPDLTDPRINQIHRERIEAEMIIVHKLLADAYIKADNHDKALENYLKANKLLANRVNFDLRNKISQIYQDKKEYKKAIEFDFHSLILSGYDIYYIVKLMEKYYLGEDIINSRKYAEQVLKFNNNNELAKKILDIN